MVLSFLPPPSFFPSLVQQLDSALSQLPVSHLLALLPGCCLLAVLQLPSLPLPPCLHAASVCAGYPEGGSAACPGPSCCPLPPSLPFTPTRGHTHFALLTCKCWTWRQTHIHPPSAQQSWRTQLGFPLNSLPDWGLSVVSCLPARHLLTLFFYYSLVHFPLGVLLPHK